MYISVYIWARSRDQWVIGPVAHVVPVVRVDRVARAAGAAERGVPVLIGDPRGFGFRVLLLVRASRE